MIIITKGKGEEIALIARWFMVSPDAASHSRLTRYELPMHINTTDQRPTGVHTYTKALSTFSQSYSDTNPASSLS